MGGLPRSGAAWSPGAACAGLTCEVGLLGVAAVPEHAAGALLAGVGDEVLAVHAARKVPQLAIEHDQFEILPRGALCVELAHEVESVRLPAVQLVENVLRVGPVKWRRFLAAGGHVVVAAPPPPPRRGRKPPAAAAAGARESTFSTHGP